MIHFFFLQVYQYFWDEFYHRLRVANFKDIIQIQVGLVLPQPFLPSLVHFGNNLLQTVRVKPRLRQCWHITLRLVVMRMLRLDLLRRNADHLHGRSLHLRLLDDDRQFLSVLGRFSFDCDDALTHGSLVLLPLDVHLLVVQLLRLQLVVHRVAIARAVHGLSWRALGRGAWHGLLLFLYWKFLKLSLVGRHCLVQLVRVLDHALGVLVQVPSTFPP